jgi:hypothetical protein
MTVTAAAPIIDLVQQELDAYRRDGRPVHLAHAARALKEALAMSGSGGEEQAHVVDAEKRR